MMTDEPRRGAGEATFEERPSFSDRHERALRSFVVLWGEMATHWGINRTMAQIHALLYASEHPLDTDEIMHRLDISRGNANINLRSLVDWNLVRKVNIPPSRKDYYVAEKDLWLISSRIIEERHRREVKPVEAALGATIEALEQAGEREPLTDQEAIFVERMQRMHRFMEVFDDLTEAMLPLLRERNAGKVTPHAPDLREHPIETLELDFPADESSSCHS
jgi:DNA-binding transcriptional regulator GbsR (MarR family)